MIGVKKYITGAGATNRVREYLDKKGITKYRFSKTTGFSNKFLDNSSNMGTDRAEIILHHYPDLSPEWLLTGRGNMCRDDEPPLQDTGEQQIAPSAPKAPGGSADAEESIQEGVADREATTAHREQGVVAFLKAELKEKELRIEELVGEVVRLKTLLEIEKREAGGAVERSGTQDVGDAARVAAG